MFSTPISLVGAAFLKKTFLWRGKRARTVPDPKQQDSATLRQTRPSQTRKSADAAEPLTRGNRGSNQVVVRSYNERLILQILRWNTRLTNPEICRATGLSPNAVSLIIRALEGAGLVLKEEPIRGRIGQPSTPVRLNPNARTFFGLKIGRRSADLVLVDFVGNVLAKSSERYDYPHPEAIRRFLKTAIRTCLKKGRRTEDEVQGFGIAMPTEIWGWSDDIGVSADDLAVWKECDAASLLPRDAPWEAIVVNDATAACIAETTFALTGDLQDAMYLFIGTLIGGGVVLNGSVFTGRSGNAGGFGPFRVPGGTVGADRLIDHASLVVLERLLRDVGEDPSTLCEDSELWSTRPEIVERWLDLSARGIAHAIASSLSVIDFQAVIIDGSLPEQVRSDLVDRVRNIFLSMDLQGLTVPEISAGHFGAISRAVGAAALPLNAEYSIDQNTLLRAQ